MSKTLTIRLGTILVVAVGVLATILKLSFPCHATEYEYPMMPDALLNCPGPRPRA